MLLERTGVPSPKMYNFTYEMLWERTGVPSPIIILDRNMKCYGRGQVYHLHMYNYT